MKSYSCGRNQSGAENQGAHFTLRRRGCVKCLKVRMTLFRECCTVSDMRFVHGNVYRRPRRMSASLRANVSATTYQTQAPREQMIHTSRFVTIPARSPIVIQHIDVKHVANLVYLGSTRLR